MFSQKTEEVDFHNPLEIPILLSGTKGNAVLVSEEDWNSIQETLYLHSIPGMVESIIEGGNTPIENCINEDSIRDILNG